MSHDLTIERGKWYGWQMLPGYGDGPYFSPIYVQLVEPQKSGKGDLKLTFINAFYAAGVQDFALTLRVFKHEETYLVGAVRGSTTDRCAVVSKLTMGWLRACCPELLRQVPPHSPDEYVQSYVKRALEQINSL